MTVLLSLTSLVKPEGGMAGPVDADQVEPHDPNAYKHQARLLKSAYCAKEVFAWMMITRTSIDDSAIGNRSATLGWRSILSRDNFSTDRNSVCLLHALQPHT
jgi:hypothetical protein